MGRGGCWEGQTCVGEKTDRQRDPAQWAGEMRVGRYVTSLHRWHPLLLVLRKAGHWAQTNALIFRNITVKNTLFLLHIKFHIVPGSGLASCEMVLVKLIGKPSLNTCIIEVCG